MELTEPNLETSVDASYAAKLARPAESKKIAFLHRHIYAEKARRLLELGCGRGTNIVDLVGIDIVGVEISPGEAQIARSRGLTVHLGNARNYADGSLYDVVMASEVIEHVVSPEELLRNAARHLVPGGMLLLTTPNGFGPWEFRTHHFNPRDHLYRSNTLRKLLKKKPYIWGDSPDHCQWFTMSRILRITREAGFTLIEQDNTDFLSGSQRDCDLASKLPHWMASGWLFAFRYEQQGQNV